MESGGLVPRIQGRDSHCRGRSHRGATEVVGVVVSTVVEDEDEGRTVGQAGTRPLSTRNRADLDQAGLSASVIELLPKSSKDRHVCMLMLLRIRLIGLRILL